MRHTYASYALDAGITIFELSRLMGTSVKVIDDTYGHLLRDTFDVPSRSEHAASPHSRAKHATTALALRRTGSALTHSIRFHQASLGTSRVVCCPFAARPIRPIVGR